VIRFTFPLDWAYLPGKNTVRGFERFAFVPQGGCHSGIFSRCAAFLADHAGIVIGSQADVEILVELLIRSFSGGIEGALVAKTPWRELLRSLQRNHLQKPTAVRNPSAQMIGVLHRRLCLLGKATDIPARPTS
jgi:hypothetical protein